MLQITSLSVTDRRRLQNQKKLFRKKISQGEPYFSLKVTSVRLADFDQTIQEIQRLLSRNKGIFLGPLFSKTRLRIPTRKSAIGTGSETWDRWVSHLYKANYRVSLQGGFIAEVSKKTFPETVAISIDLKS